MPTPHNPKLPLRLAFSHKEKAEVAIRQCDRSLQDGGIDRDHHTKLRAQYERELQLAKRKIERLVGIERARLEKLEAQRRAALEEQLHLGERVSAGKLSAQDANNTNRRLTHRLAELNAQIDVCRGREETHTSEQAGGFIDLPFSEYVTTEARNLNSVPGSARGGEVRMRDWYFTGAFALIAAVSIFLPWFDTDGAVSSLARPDSTAIAIGSQSGISPVFAPFAWILFAVLPFIGVLMTAGRSVRLFGWGYLCLGLAMLALAAYPSLAVGVRGAAVSASVVGLASAFRIGAVLYCASAIGFVVLGAFRVSPPGDSLRHAMTVSLALLGALAVVGLLAAFALIGVQGAAQVSFNAVLDESTRDRVAFVVNNEGRDPVVCYFPLPVDMPGSEPSASDSHTFGMHVEVRERNREMFSAVQVSPQVWRFSQGPLPTSGEMLVNPGTALKGTLDLRQLTSLGVEPAAVRLQLLALDGSLVNEAEVELGERYLSTPARIRDPLIIAPPPARPVLSGEPKPEANTSAAPVAVPIAPIHVEYIGGIGAQGVFRVHAQDGSGYTEVKAGEGGAVSGGWTVDSFTRQPPGAVMVHKESGARAQAARGVVVELKVAS